MARVAGIDLPKAKKIQVALTYIYGVGSSLAKQILSEAQVDPDKKSDELNDDEVASLRNVIDRSYQVEGDLRREVNMNVKRLIDLGCYRGIRHRRKLPVRGQTTHSNARTRKGKAVAIAGKKSIKQLK